MFFYPRAVPIYIPVATPVFDPFGFFGFGSRPVEPVRPKVESSFGDFACSMYDVMHRVGTVISDAFRALALLFIRACRAIGDAARSLVTKARSPEQRQAARERVEVMIQRTWYASSPAPVHKNTPPAPSYKKELSETELKLGLALKLFEDMPSETPRFEKRVLQDARRILSANEIDDIENMIELPLFAHLILRSIVFQAGSICPTNASVSGAWKVPAYCDYSTIAGLRTKFWKLSPEDKMAIVDHIASEIKPSGDKFILTSTAQGRKSIPKEATISPTAKAVYLELRALERSLIQGNRLFAESLAKVIQ